MSFKVWAYWQYARLKCFALQARIVQDIAEYLAYIKDEIRNPGKDIVPGMELPGPSLSFEAQAVGPYRHRQVGKRKK